MSQTQNRIPNIAHSDHEGRYTHVLRPEYITRSILPLVGHVDRDRQSDVAPGIALAVAESRERRHAHHERYLRIAGRRAFFDEPTTPSKLLRDSIHVFAHDLSTQIGDEVTLYGDTVGEVAVELGHETQNGLWGSLDIDKKARYLPRQFGGTGLQLVELYPPFDPRTGYKFMRADHDTTEQGSLIARRHRPVADVVASDGERKRKIEIVKSSFFAIDSDGLEAYENALIDQAISAGDDTSRKALHTVAGKVVVEPRIVAFRESKGDVISPVVLPAETTYFALHRLAS